MSFLSNDSSRQDVEQFWHDLEQSLGSPIHAHALGRYISGRDEAGPLWGLLYVTVQALYFHHFAQANWFSSLLTSADGRAKVLDTVTIEVPLQAGMELRSARPPGWRRFLSGESRDVYMLLAPGDESASEEPFVFTVEQRKTGLVPELRRVLGERP